MVQESRGDTVRLLLQLSVLGILATSYTIAHALAVVIVKNYGFWELQ